MPIMSLFSLSANQEIGEIGNFDHNQTFLGSNRIIIFGTISFNTSQ